MNLFSRSLPYGGFLLLALVVGWSIVYWTETRAVEEPKPFVGGMFGGTPARNMANTVDRDVPTSWSAEEGKFKNIKWSEDLGSKTFGGPLVVDGKVYVGTNNANPRDPKIKGALKAVLMCFEEKTGKFLWQAVHDFPPDDTFNEARDCGLASTPCVEGQRLYYVTPGCAVICADVADGKALWHYDMMKELQVKPHHMSACSPLIVGDLLMVMTGNGVNEEHEVAAPKAPSFIALKKDKGTLAWQNNLPGKNIIQGQWSNPAYAVVDGRPQVLFPGGDSVMYSFDPKTGKLLWKCNCLPGRKVDAEDYFDNYFIATPVIYDHKIHIGLGYYPGNAKSTNFSYLVCLDMTKSGDASPKNLVAKDPANKDSALVWAFGGPINPKPPKGRKTYFGRTISTCAIHDGLLYIAEQTGYFYCLDAKTGQKYWETDLKDGIWGSPYYVDGKVMIGTDGGELVVFKAGKEMKILSKNDMGEAVHGTPVVSGNVVFIATKSKLYAIEEKK